uniref:Conjugal transfer protein TrbE n=1 Tax=Steinernema glaseri TaxID=37863 RepID=A0A1I8ALR7_9BILA
RVRFSKDFSLAGFGNRIDLAISTFFPDYSVPQITVSTPAAITEQPLPSAGKTKPRTNRALA